MRQLVVLWFDNWLPTWPGNAVENLLIRNLVAESLSFGIFGWRTERRGEWLAKMSYLCQLAAERVEEGEEYVLLGKWFGTWIKISGILAYPLDLKMNVQGVIRFPRDLGLPKLHPPPAVTFTTSELQYDQRTLNPDTNSQTTSTKQITPKLQTYVNKQNNNSNCCQVRNIPK